MITTQFLLVKLVMALSAILAAGVMYRRSHNPGWLFFVAWVMIATSNIFEHYIDPFNAGGTPMHMIPKWKRDWWTVRSYIDPILLCLSMLFIAFRKHEAHQDTLKNCGQLIGGWLVPTFFVGFIGTIAFPYLMFVVIGGTKTEGFAAAGAGWFAMLGGYMIIVIYVYLSLPSLAFTIIRYGDRDSMTFMKRSAIIQLCIYVASAASFAGYIAIAKNLKS